MTCPSPRHEHDRGTGGRVELHSFGVRLGWFPQPPDVLDAHGGAGGRLRPRSDHEVGDGQGRDRIETHKPHVEHEGGIRRDSPRPGRAEAQRGWDDQPPLAPRAHAGQPLLEPGDRQPRAQQIRRGVAHGRLDLLAFIVGPSLVIQPEGELEGQEVSVGCRVTGSDDEVGDGEGRALGWRGRVGWSGRVVGRAPRHHRFQHRNRPHDNAPSPSPCSHHHRNCLSHRRQHAPTTQYMQPPAPTMALGEL